MKEYDVVVVGLGPAGVCACIQLHREGFSVLGVECERIGGALHDATLIENLPIAGHTVEAKQLIKNLGESIKAHGIEVFYEKVEAIERKRECFLVRGKSRTFRARAVIVATGVVPRKLPGLRLKKNVFYRPRDVGEVSGLRVAIIGAGDAGLDAALKMASTASKVFVFARHKPGAIRPLIERARSKANIQIFENAKIDKIERRKQHISITSLDGISVECDKLLISVGKERDLSIFPQSLRKKIGEKRLISQELCEGLYAAGDFQNMDARYISTALGSGMQAAVLAARYLRGGKNGSAGKERK